MESAEVPHEQLAEVRRLQDEVVRSSAPLVNTVAAFVLGVVISLSMFAVSSAAGWTAAVGSTALYLGWFRWRRHVAGVEARIPPNKPRSRVFLEMFVAWAVLAVVLNIPFLPWPVKAIAFAGICLGHYHVARR
ncbi:MAG TPA: hypothetical protein VMY34_08295 [Acidimicrobiales bacterium]|nr:hypothetical protein [Acidimicrobiales bacterium]